MHKEIKSRSIKNHAVDAYENAQRKINFPKNECFADVNRAYSDFFQRLMTVTDNVAPCKTTMRVKGNTQNGFDGEVLETLRSTDKLFKSFKKMRLYINKELYKKAKYDVLKLIAAKSKYCLMKNSQKVLANQKNYGTP